MSNYVLACNSEPVFILKMKKESESEMKIIYAFWITIVEVSTIVGLLVVIPALTLGIYLWLWLIKEILVQFEIGKRFSNLMRKIIVKVLNALNLWDKLGIERKK